MPVQHRASAVPSVTTTTTSFTIVIPAGTVAGDVLYLAFTSRDHLAATALPTVTDNDTGGNAWTRVTGSTDRKANLYRKFATSGTASKTITVSGCVGSSSGVVSVFSGPDSGTPDNALTLETNASNDESHAAIIPSRNNSVVCLAVFNYANDNAVTVPAGASLGSMTFTEHLSTGGNDCATAFARAQQTTAASTGALTWSQVNGTTYSIAFAINPSDGVGSIPTATISVVNGSAAGQANTSGLLVTSSVSAPQGAAQVNISVSGSVPTATVSAPDASESSEVNISAALVSVSIVQVDGSAEGQVGAIDGNASGSIPGSALRVPLATSTFRYYRFHILDAKSSGYPEIQFHELTLRRAGVRQQPINAYWYNASPFGDGAAVNAFDQDSQKAGATPVSYPAGVVFDYGSPVMGDTFDWQTANDTPARDPAKWLYQGSNDEVNWVTLHDQSATAYIATDTRFIVVGPFALIAQGITGNANASGSLPTITVSSPSASVGYAAVVFADNPVGYWRLGETNGITALDAKGSYNGTFLPNNTSAWSGGTLGSSGAIQQDTNGSIKFNGTGYVEIPNISTALGLATQATIEFWFYRPNSTWPLVCIGFGQSQSYRFNVVIDNRIYCQAENTSPSYPFSSEVDVITPPGQWHHIVFSFDGSLGDNDRAKLYVNGVNAPLSVGNGFGAGAVPATVLPNAGLLSNFYIGREPANNRYTIANIVVDEVAVYNYALSAAQASAHYSANVPLTLLYAPETFGGTLFGGRLPLTPDGDVTGVGSLPTASIASFGGNAASSTTVPKAIIPFIDFEYGQQGGWSNFFGGNGSSYEYTAGAISGSKSLRLVSGTNEWVYHSFHNHNEIWGRTKIKIEACSAPTGAGIFLWQSTEYNNGPEIYYDNSVNKFGISGGIGGFSLVDVTTSIGQTVYIWWRMKAASFSGANNGLLDIWVSTTPTRPANGSSGHASRTDGYMHENFRTLHVKNGGGTTTVVIDDFILMDGDTELPQPPYVIDENFDTTPIEGATGWRVVNGAEWFIGTPSVWPYTALPISGAGSLKIQESYTIASTAFRSKEVWGSMRIRFLSPVSTGSGSVFILYNTEGTITFNFWKDSTTNSVITITNWGTQSWSETPVLQDVDYYLWFHYRAKIGSTNGIGEVWIGTTPTRANAEWYLPSVNDLNTSDVSNLTLYDPSGKNPYVIDDLKVALTDVFNGEFVYSATGSIPSILVLDIEASVLTDVNLSLALPTVSVTQINGSAADLGSDASASGLLPTVTANAPQAKALDYIIFEDFEDLDDKGNSYHWIDGVRWFVNGGVDWPSTELALEGKQSLKNPAAYAYAWDAGQPLDEVFVSFKMRIESINTNSGFLFITNPTGGGLLSPYIHNISGNTGSLLIDGDAPVITNFTITGVTYNVWMHAKRKMGSVNGTASIAISTGNNRETAEYSTSGTYTTTEQFTGLQLGFQGTIYYDSIKIAGYDFDAPNVAHAQGSLPTVYTRKRSAVYSTDFSFITEWNKPLSYFSGWVDVSGQVWTNDTEKYAMPGASFSLARNTTVLPADQYASLVFTSDNQASTYGTVAVRVSDTENSYYGVRFISDLHTFEIFECVGGTVNLLASKVIQKRTSPPIAHYSKEIRISVSGTGSNIQLFADIKEDGQWNQILNATPTTAFNSGYAGIGGAGGWNHNKIDDFESGTFYSSSLTGTAEEVTATNGNASGSIPTINVSAPVATATGNTPQSIPNLVIWLDASSLSLNNNDPVTSWPDLSGAGNNAAPSFINQNPVYKTNVLGGRPVINLNKSSGQQFKGSFVHTGDQLTVFVVSRVIADGTDFFSRIFSIAGATGFDYNSIFNAAVIRQANNLNQFGAERWSTGLSYVNTPKFDWHLFCSQFSGSEHTFYADGVAGNPVSISGAFNTTEYRVGGRADGNTSGDELNGEVAEVIVYNRSLTTAERNIITDYLNQKYFAGMNAIGSIPTVSVDEVYALVSSDVNISGALPTISTSAPQGIARNTVPASIPNLGFWLDASILGLADGTPVSSWTDSSSNNLNATHGVNSERPIFKTNILNGKPVVRFDKTATQRLFGSLAHTGTELTVFVVGKLTDAGDNVWSRFVSLWNGSFGYDFDNPQSTIPLLQFGTSNEFAGHRNGVVLSRIAVTKFDWHLYCSQYDGTNHTIYADGVAGTPYATSGAFGIQTYCIGHRSDGSTTGNDGLHGDIAEVILYTRSLTSGERDSVTNYLNEKYFGSSSGNASGSLPTVSLSAPSGTPKLGNDFVTSFVLGGIRNNFSGWVGMRVNVGATPLSITQLGRLKSPGDSANHTVKLVKASDGIDIPGGSVSINMSAGIVGQFHYGTLASPIILSAGTEYYIVSSEVSGGDGWYNYDTSVTPTSDATIPGNVYGIEPNWFPDPNANLVYGPSNFRYELANIPAAANGNLPTVTVTAINGIARVGVPAAIPNLGVWLDASALTLNDTDPVASWTDSSVNNAAAIQSLAQQRPIYRTNVLNGKPVVRFDKTYQQRLIGPFTHTGDELTVFVVCKMNTGSVQENARILSMVGATGVDHNSQANVIPLYQLSTGSFFGAYRNNSVLSNANSGNEYGWYLWGSQFNGSDHTLYLNGVAAPWVASSGAFNLTKYGVGLSADETNLTECFHGDIAEIIVYKRSLTTQERNDVTTYLSEKYFPINASGSLPTVTVSAPEATAVELRYIVLTSETGSISLSGIDATLSASGALAGETGSFSVSGIDAGYILTRTLPASTGEFVFAGQDSSLKTSLSLSAQAGSFALAGIDSGYNLVRSVVSETGAFALSGQSAETRVSYVLTSETGLFTLAGETATFNNSGKINAEAGAIELTGQSANIYVGYKLSADTGTFNVAGIDSTYTRLVTLTSDTFSFNLSGQDALTKVSYRLEASVGTFNFAGVDATFSLSGKISGDTGQFTLSGQSAETRVSYKLISDVGLFALAGQSAEIRTDYNLQSSVGSFSLAGSDATFNLSGKISGDTGQFNLTGQSAEVKVSYKLISETGSFNVSGVSSEYTRLVTLTSDVGNYTLNGQSSDIRTSYVLSASTGTVDFTGIAASFSSSGSLGGGTGSYVIDGQDASIKVGYRLQSETGTFDLTGIASQYTRLVTLTSDTTSYNVTCQSALTAVNYVLPSDSTSYSLVGQDAAITKSSYATADSGSFVLSGQDAGTKVNYKLSASAGSFSLTGIDSTYNRSVPLVAETGAFTVAGIQAQTLVSYKLTSETGSFDLTGVDASYNRSGGIIGATGTFSVDGQDAQIKVSYKLSASTGAFSLSGVDAGYNKTLTVISDAGSFAIAGQSAETKVSYVLSASSGSVILAGSSAASNTSSNIDASTGQFLLDGKSATILVSYKLSSDTGVFSLTGGTADSAKEGNLNGLTGEFALNAAPAITLVTRVLSASEGSFDSTENDGSLKVSKVLSSDSGSSTASAADAALIRDLKLEAALVSLALQLRDADIYRSLLSDIPSITVTGINGTASAGITISPSAFTSVSISSINGFAAGTGAGVATGSLPQLNIIEIRYLDVKKSSKFKISQTDASKVIISPSTNSITLRKKNLQQKICPFE